jgi:transcriptional regulator with XRE-family HTH domain
MKTQNNLRQNRKEHNLSQAAVSDIVGVTKMAVSHREHGTHHPAKLYRETNPRLLGVPVEEIFPPLK